MNSSPTVLVVDDDDLMRDLLARVFINAAIPAKTFASATALLDSNDLRSPAVLLLDVKMPGMSGLQLQALLRARGSLQPVIFLTGASDVPMAVAAMRNGALDFIEKPFIAADLVTRVRRAIALRAEPTMHAVFPPGTDAARLLQTLTVREREVYDRMVVGRTSKDIAGELGGSFRTVEIHRGRVMGKMGAAHLADLVRMAIETNSPA